SRPAFPACPPGRESDSRLELGPAGAGLRLLRPVPPDPRFSGVLRSAPHRLSLPAQQAALAKSRPPDLTGQFFPIRPFPSCGIIAADGGSSRKPRWAADVNRARELEKNKGSLMNKLILSATLIGGGVGSGRLLPSVAAVVGLVGVVVGGLALARSR